MLTYLKEKNIPFKPVLKEKNYGEDTELLKMIDKKLSNKLPETYGGFDETMTFEPEIRKIANEYYSKLYKDIPSFQGKEFHSEPLGFSQVMSYLDALRKYKKDTNGTETDKRKTEEKLKKVVKKKGYEEWLNEISKNLVAEKGIRNKKIYLILQVIESHGNKHMILTLLKM